MYLLLKQIANNIPFLWDLYSFLLLRLFHWPKINKNINNIQ